VTLPSPTEYSLRSRREAGVFLLAALLPGLFLVLEALRIGLASALGASTNVSDLGRASRLDPANAELEHRLGQVYSYAPGELDPAEGLRHLERATELNPGKPSYWADLGSACESTGNRECADRSFERALALSPMTPHLYWTNANYNLRTGRVEKALPLLRRLLELDPSYAEPTFDLCLRMLDDPEIIFRQVVPTGRQARLRLGLARFLVTHGHADFSYQVWRETRETLTPPAPFPLAWAEPYLESLLELGRYSEALSVWQDLERLGLVTDFAAERGRNLVFNGGFERWPLNTGFDWRYREESHLSIDFSNFRAYAGARCLALDYVLAANEEDEPVYQIVAVIPGERYRLTAYVRSEDITSDSGPRLRVVSLECPNCLNASSPAVVGTTDWHPVELEFSVGGGTRFVRLSIWRPRSRAFPSNITGRFWLDAVSLKAESRAPSVAKALAPSRAS